MKLTTTLALLHKHEACQSRYKVLLAALGTDYPQDKPIELLTILEINGIEDAIWALCATVEDCEKSARLMATDFAELSLPNWTSQYPGDNRLALAIQAARNFANGLITDEERSAAWAAARSAAESAAEAAAWAAAWAAAESAAESAAHAAAWAAAWAASRSAACAAAWAAAESAAESAAHAAAWAAAWASIREIFVK